MRQKSLAIHHLKSITGIYPTRQWNFMWSPAETIYSNHFALSWYVTEMGKIFCRWDDRMSAVIPKEEVFYSVGLLRSAVRDWEFYEEQNREILRACERRKLGVKMYLPYYTEEREWRRHFGEKWTTFLARKLRFDPRWIFGTGQRIFPFPLLPSNLKRSAPI